MAAPALDGGSGFVKKLYTMVSDEDIPEIRWSADGESFLITEPSKLASERLGAFFKHKNLPSFVRQLNMYDFSKVQHISDGNLNSSGEEALEFRNPNFKRGRPELLKKLERKKGPADGGRVIRRPAAGDVTETSGLHPQAVLAKLAELRDEQVAIHTEFKALQQENRLLWQEAIKSSDRHKRNSDSINAIIRFLGSVYGAKVLEPGEQRNGGHATSQHSTSAEPGRRRLLLKNLPEQGSYGQGQLTEVEIPIDEELPVISSDTSYHQPAPSAKPSMRRSPSTPASRFEDLGANETMDPSLSAALNAIASNSQISDSTDFARLLSSYDFSQPEASTSAVPMTSAPTESLSLTPRPSHLPLIASSAPSINGLQSFLDLPSSSAPVQLPSLPAPLAYENGGGGGGGAEERALQANNARLDAMTKRMDTVQSGIDSLMSSLAPAGGDLPYDETFWDQFINQDAPVQSQGQGEPAVQTNGRIETLSASSGSNVASPVPIIEPIVATPKSRVPSGGKKRTAMNVTDGDDDDFVLPSTKRRSSRKRTASKG